MDINKCRGHAAVLGANLIFGLNIPITKALLTHWMTPLGYMATRALMAVIVFWTISLFIPKERVPVKDLIIMGIGSFMGFIVSQFLTAVSLQYTSPVYFSLILAMSPVVVMMLAALFLKEPVTRQKTLGVVMGIAGALLLISRIDPASSAGSNNLWGIFLAVISIIAFSVYLIIMRSVSQKYGEVTQMKWMFLFAAVILVPFGVGELSQQAIFSAAWDWTGVGEIAFVVVFATSICYFLMPLGMKYLRATTVSVYMNLQPVVASIAAIFVGQDVFTWDKPIAAILVLTGTYVVTQSPAKEHVKKEINQ